MIEAPTLAQTATQHTAVIRFNIPRSRMGEVMGPGVGELLATLREQGVVPAGPLFTHHLTMEPDIFDFELGVAVATPVQPSGRVQPSQLLANTVARTIYHGPYEGLSEAWRELMAWAADSGYKPAADLWECYLAGPESGADPGGWRTELNRPVSA